MAKSRFCAQKRRSPTLSFASRARTLTWPRRLALLTTRPLISLGGAALLLACTAGTNAPATGRAGNSGGSATGAAGTHGPGSGGVGGSFGTTGAAGVLSIGGSGGGGGQTC